MKYLWLIVFCLSAMVVGLAFCGGKTAHSEGTYNSPNRPNLKEGKMKIKIGNKTFTATLYDNATEAAFRTLLPITVNMIELNGNEKYVELSRDLTTNASNPGTIHAGDLMLYGSSTFVLFYKTFSTSYSYTRVGRINNVTGLADAVGSGNVSVTLNYSN